MNLIPLEIRRPIRYESFCPVLEYIENNYDKLFSHKKNQRTRNTYKNNGKIFLTFLRDRGGFNDTTIEAFVNWVPSTTSSIHSQAARCTACKIIVDRVNFFRADLIPDSIHKKLTKYVDWIRSPKKSLRSGHNDDDMERIKDYLNNLEDNGEKTRLKAQFALLAIQGLRGSEAIRVQVEDLNFNRQRIRVIRKGGEVERVRMFTATVKLLKEYMNFHGIEKGYLFKLKRKNKVMGWKQASTEWKHIFRTLGMGDYRPHDFRHYLGTKTALKTGNPFDVKMLLGHKSIRTSQFYIDDIVNDQAFEKLDKFIGY